MNDSLKFWNLLTDKRIGENEDEDDVDMLLIFEIEEYLKLDGDGGPCASIFEL